jgi:sulfide:quinone oxidoreductase
MTRVVVLGAGFGGLELSARLAEDLSDEVRVTLIDQNDAFVFGFSKLDVMFGLLTFEDVRLPYREIAIPGVEFHQESILSIDPHAKRVVTNAGTYDADILVVALGADLEPAATPGLQEVGHEFYSPENAALLRDVIADFEGGNVVVAVLGGFFKCPPAPYETAFMMHDHLTQKGLRSSSTITIVTPMPKPIPISDEVSNAITGLLDERGITYSHATWVDHVDPAARVLHLRDGGEVPFDLLLAIPVHRAPAVVAESGLTEEDGWIAVDPDTLATKFADVYAVGDVASAPVPRAGVIAEGEARTVADVLVHRLKGGPEAPPFLGEILCLMEMGEGNVARVSVNFRSGPNPTARFMPPSLEGTEAKRAFGATRRRRWFGRN